MKEWFWSNCVIVAFIHKLNDWGNIELVPLWRGWHFHMMWHERSTDTFWHFTDRKGGKLFTALLFKGHIEIVKRKFLEKWCKSVGIELKV